MFWKNLAILMCACSGASIFVPGVSARQLDVTEFTYTGPIVLPQPLMVDTIDLKNEAFDAAKMLDYTVNLLNLKGSPVSIKDAPALSGPVGQRSLGLLQFWLNAPHFAKTKLTVEGLKDKKVFVDGAEVTDLELKLEPATHQVVIKYLTDTLLTDTLRVSLDVPDGNPLALRTDGRRLFSFDENLYGARPYSLAPSPDGRYLLYCYYTTTPQGSNDYTMKVVEASSGRQLRETDTQAQWLPRSNKYYFTRQGLQGRELVYVDPATNVEEVAARGIPEGWFVVSPTEDCLFYSIKEDGPKELDAKVFQIVNPEDRLKGYRDRSRLARYDLSTGVLQPLTFGHHDLGLSDVSADGKKVLFYTADKRFTRRPTTLVNLYLLDVPTMTVDTLVVGDGFLDTALLCADGTKVAVSGSPEAFGGIANRVPKGRIPSMIERELFIIDVPSKEVKAMTADFDPSITSFEWNPYDGQIYMLVEEGFTKPIYRLDPRSGKFYKYDLPEEVIGRFALADNAPVGAFSGQGGMSAGGVYTFDLRSGKSRVIDRPKDAQLANVDLPKTYEWDFVNSRGDTIQCWYYLPPDFDPSKQYPVILNYYGGCSPQTRYFGGHYPHQQYASLGYVAMVMNPSGATGYGQEFSSRHVNTAGEGVADDIIEGVKKFTDEHPWVNPKKIGCVGASYGGFMTMDLQTKTDIFAAAVSHAGISDHTSYWGEGDWGYSYSEVSMADSYPWSDPDLYVKRSPLFNADKIHTPILFLHGTIDNNVPPGESIQMFNALSLLGRPCALVMVDGEQHGIMDVAKRRQWQKTMLAWFAKYLQDDPSWWDALYPPKAL